MEVRPASLCCLQNEGDTVAGVVVVVVLMCCAMVVRVYV